MDFSTLSQAQINIDGNIRTCYFRPDTSDQKVLNQILGRGEYDFGRLPQFAEMKAAIDAQFALGKTPLIIDAGANIGVSSIFFATTYTGAIVYAIEPELSNFELLVENTKGLSVICKQAALSHKSGHAKVVDNGRGFWGFETEDSDEVPGSISTITMDEIIDQEVTDDRWLLMAKMDIEGAESGVFEGHPNWVDKVPVLIVELHDWLFPKKRTSRSFMRCMTDVDDRDIITKGEYVIAVKHQLI
ncbi:MAG TPA: FkbM family methyltransferase [Fimbriimonadaceae bacterium]|jgi:FkbM family methyltransferase